MDIEKLVEEQTEAARRRQNEIKRYIFITWVYMLLVSAVFSFAILNISQSNEELSATINRRSPVLEYIRCHDRLEDTKSSYQANLIFTYIDFRENPSESTSLNYTEAREKYEEADKKLLSLDSCPKFPE